MYLVRCREDDCALLAFGRRQAIVHVVRRMESEADVVMLGVVPGEEIAAEDTSVLDAAEAIEGTLPPEYQTKRGQWRASSDRRSAGLPGGPA